MLHMQEIELKFQIPAHALETVRAELARLATVETPANSPALLPPLVLQAAYFDTPDRRLAQARSALRVRREGDDWVQTLKAAGSHTMLRVEDNRATMPPAAGHAARPDLGLHAGGPAEAALRHALGWDPANDPSGQVCGLVALYRTDMRRTRVQLSVAAGTPQAGTVELALDEGDISAGEGAARQAVPVRELEIELLSGHPHAVILAARPWVQRFGLWLDTQTKAHRGDRLARQVIDGEVVPPHAHAPRWRHAQASASGPQQATLAAEACLSHLTAHMSELASLDAQAPGAADVAWQWGRGLRRLRAIGAWAAQWPLGDAMPGGLHRAGTLAASLQPPLARALVSGDMAAAIALARSPEATEACLQVLTALTHPS
jgi:triphosphatase